MGVNTRKYKQTELGLIPNEWAIKTYGEVFNFLTSATYSRADLGTNDDVSYIHYGDIHTKFECFIDFDKSTLPTISNDKVKQYPLLKNGDLIVVDASEDYTGIAKSVEVKNIDNKKAITGLHTFLLRDKNQNFVTGFKGYLHANNKIKSQFDKLATGMKVYGVSKTNLKQVLIPIPTIELILPSDLTLFSINIPPIFLESDIMSFGHLIVHRKLSNFFNASVTESVIAIFKVNN